MTLSARMHPTFLALPGLLTLRLRIQRPVVEPNRSVKIPFMRASAIRSVPVLVALSLFLNIRLLSAQYQPHRKGAKARQTSIKIIEYFGGKKWLDEDVRYIITDEERAAFKALTTDEERDDFVEAFWYRRNPNPFSEENQFKEEHYARFVYANERFAGRTPGWKTDRGRIYIVYGPPDEREEYPGRTDTLPAACALQESFSSEIWRYDFIEGLGYGVFFVFQDKCGCGEYLLQHNPRGQVSILYGPPDWVDYHYSDAISNCEAVSTVKGPIDWEVWHYRSIEGIGKDIGFGFSDACDYGKFEGPIFWERIHI
jgi:GWxTD domain-containing protein